MKTNPFSNPDYLTDKFRHGLIEHYKKILAPLRHRPVRLLEIGIEFGGSIHLWDDYLTHEDSRIIGLDLVVPELSVSDRVTLKQIDQNDRPALEEIAESCGPLDIVIDDGAHRKAETINCFEVFFGRLSKGGYYAIEDWAVGYATELPEFAGMIEVVTDIIRDAIGLGVSDIHVIREGPTTIAIFRKK